jgi:hypothetical protein
MFLVYFLLNLTTFCWGSICLNSFREAFRYNALGDYTEINVDINSLLCLSVVNVLMMTVNYSNITFLTVLNGISMIVLFIFNIINFQNCNLICYDFYSNNRFNYYYTFYMVLPYLQLVIILIIIQQLHKKIFMRNSCTQSSYTSRLELISNEIE